MIGFGMANCSELNSDEVAEGGSGGEKKEEPESEMVLVSSTTEYR
jgi:hypothetical protein